MANNQESSDSEVEFNINNHASGDEEDYRGEIGDHNYGAAEIRRRRSRPPQIKPDPFTGEEDWDQYLSYFEDCSELAQWSEKEKLLYLATSLKHQARLQYSSIPFLEKRSYRALVAKLGQRFGSKRQQTRWLSKMHIRTRGESESIAVFGDELRLLACKAYVKLDPEAQEMLALQHLYKSVSAELRCRLMDQDCKTISEAVEVVERYEDVLGQMNTGDSAGPSRVRGVSNTLGKDTNDSKGQQNDVERIKGAIKRIEGRLDKEKCWLCEAMFPTLASLHSHLISSAHRRLTVLCPWCIGKEKTFTRVHDLEVHVKTTHPSEEASKERFSRANGFYFAKYPEDYARIVDKVGAYDSNYAYEARKAIRVWAEGFSDRKVRTDKWNMGWKAGVEIAGSKCRDMSRETSVEGDSRKVVEVKSDGDFRKRSASKQVEGHDKDRGERSKDVENEHRTDSKNDRYRVDRRDEERDYSTRYDGKQRETTTERSRDSVDSRGDAGSNVECSSGRRDRSVERNRDKEKSRRDESVGDIHSSGRRDTSVERNRDKEKSKKTDSAGDVHSSARRDPSVERNRDKEKSKKNDSASDIHSSPRRDTSVERNRDKKRSRRDESASDIRGCGEGDVGRSEESGRSCSRKGASEGKDVEKASRSDEVSSRNLDKDKGKEVTRKDKIVGDSAGDHDVVETDKEGETSRKRNRSSEGDKREVKQKKQDDKIEEAFENYSDDIELGEEASVKPSRRERSPSPSASSSSSSSGTLYRAMDDGLGLKAKRILMKGYMPVCPPARRDWSNVDEFTLESMGITVKWPPENWRIMTPDQRLMSHEFIAMFLERTLGKGFPLLSRRALLDKYNFMALEGEGKPPEEEKSGDKTDAKIRYYNFSYMKCVARGEVDDTRMSRSIVSSVERASRWTDTDQITEKLDSAGIKLKI